MKRPPDLKRALLRINGVPRLIDERNHQLTATATMREEGDVGCNENLVEILEDGANQAGHSTEMEREHTQDRRDFIRLSRRNAQLVSSLRADDQRERARLQVPLMRLYMRLNPTSYCTWSDDFDVVTRAERRT